MDENELIVRKLWEIFNTRKFSNVKPLLSDDFMCVWPQSNELIRGADNFVSINENYPGKWTINCKRVICCGENAISEVELTCDKQKVYATSFFEIKNGKITKLTEYWGEPYDAPEWRIKWTEKVESR